MKASVIVWDLETAPDFAGFAAANDLVGTPDADVRAALGNKFPKHIYHTIVCIGALVVPRMRIAKRAARIAAADDDGNVAAALALHRRERAHGRAGELGAPIGPVERPQRQSPAEAAPTWHSDRLPANAGAAPCR
jgi:hypothetical protein